MFGASSNNKQSGNTITTSSSKKKGVHGFKKDNKQKEHPDSEGDVFSMAARNLFAAGKKKGSEPQLHMANKKIIKSANSASNNNKNWDNVNRKSGKGNNISNKNRCDSEVVTRKRLSTRKKKKLITSGNIDIIINSSPKTTTTTTTNNNSNNSNNNKKKVEN